MSFKGKQTDDSKIAIWRCRLGYMFRFFGRIVHYGFVPMVLYFGVSLGQTEPGAPELTLKSFFWQ